MKGGSQTSSEHDQNIFLSYRREDSAGHTGRLYDHLCRHFSNEQIFIDVGTIRPGDDFVEVIQNVIGSCRIFIAIIGRHWLNTFDLQTRRIDYAEDFVRLEIVTALNRNILVLPVLVQGARMPLQENLPSDLHPLCRRQALELDDARWGYDVARLIQIVEEEFGKGSTKRAKSNVRGFHKYLAWLRKGWVYWALRSLAGLQGVVLGVVGWALLINYRQYFSWNWKTTLAILLSALLVGQGISHLIPHRLTIKGYLFHIKFYWLLVGALLLLVNDIRAFRQMSEVSAKSTYMLGVFLVLLQLIGALTLVLRKRISGKPIPESDA